MMLLVIVTINFVKQKSSLKCYLQKELNLCNSLVLCDTMETLLIIWDQMEQKSMEKLMEWQQNRSVHSTSWTILVPTAKFLSPLKISHPRVNNHLCLTSIKRRWFFRLPQLTEYGFVFGRGIKLKESGLLLNRW